MNENKIYRNVDPDMGPIDGVQMKTDCVRTKFTEEKEAPFEQTNGKAIITASIESGTFSIRDLQANIMLTVRATDAMEICSAVCATYKSLHEGKT